MGEKKLNSIDRGKILDECAAFRDALRITSMRVWF